MNKQAGQKGIQSEGPSKNPLSEKIKDISLLIIPKGSVLLLIVEKENVANQIYLPDTVNKSEFGGMYYEVFKTGDDDFKKTHPEFIPHSDTKVGNIAISVRPGMDKLYTNKGKEYLLIPDSRIECQVTSDNFEGF